MGTISVNGTSIDVNENGYQQNINDWNTEIASHLANAEGIAMTEQHWEVVNFLRDYYRRYQIAPIINILVRQIERKFGPEKGNTRYLEQLFPEGPAKQACKIAGLPKPTGCL